MEEVFREKDKGVSAIVGTILIVAITVVLAATVYGVLTGFGGLISGGAPTGAISVSNSGTTYTVTFTQLSKNVTLSNVNVKYTTASGYTGIATSFSGNVTISNSQLNIGSVITLDITAGNSTGVALTSISILDTSPSGTIASWSST